MPHSPPTNSPFPHSKTHASLISVFGPSLVNFKKQKEQHAVSTLAALVTPLEHAENFLVGGFNHQPPLKNMNVKMEINHPQFSGWM